MSFSVNENVDTVEQFVRDILEVSLATRHKVAVVDVTRVTPDVLLGQLTDNELTQREEFLLVLRLHGVTAQKRQATNVGGSKALDNLVSHFSCEGLAEREALRLFVEASRTVNTAARDEQRRTHAHSVCDVTVFDGSVVHGSPPWYFGLSVHKRAPQGSCHGALRI